MAGGTMSVTEVNDVNLKIDEQEPTTTTTMTKIIVNSELKQVGLTDGAQNIVSNNNADEEQSNVVLSSSRKKSRNRPRKKKMYTEICKQLEFYFSDANISKNRMMRELVTATEYVDLKVFWTFHKIQKLVPDSDIVALQKALAQSTTLVLSEDLFGVKRKVPYDEAKLKPEAEIEKCTIYVENIPSHFDHEKLKKIFQEFGPVAYVAIPKARQTGLSKGFAFVEFEKEQGAESCLNAYGDIGACLPGNMDPGDLLSVKTFESPFTQAKAASQDEQSSSSNSKSSRKRARPTDNENLEQQDEDNDEEQGVQPLKKRKEKIGEADEDQNQPSSTETINNKTAENVDNIIDDLNNQVSSNSGENHNKSCEKKRRRKNYKNKKIESIEQCESESIQLRIMAKRNWKQLRSRYLNVQRENLGKLKGHFRHQRPPQQSRQAHTHPSGIKKRNEPTVLVKVPFSQPLEDEESFKSRVKNEMMPQKWSTALQYIDCFPNHAIVKIDGHVIEAVSKFVHNASHDFPDVEILSAAAAKEYWESVRSDLKDDRKKKNRGRDKIMQNAMSMSWMKTSQHIRFEEEDETSTSQSLLLDPTSVVVAQDKKSES